VRNVPADLKPMICIWKSQVGSPSSEAKNALGEEKRGGLTSRALGGSSDVRDGSGACVAAGPVSGQ